MPNLIKYNMKSKGWFIIYKLRFGKINKRVAFYCSYSQVVKLRTWCRSDSLSKTPALKAQPDNTEGNQDFNSFSAFRQNPDTKVQIAVEHKIRRSLVFLKCAHRKQA